MRTTLLGLFLCLASVSIAHADARKSEELIQQGLELRRAGKDADAVPLFRRAYELLPTPRAAAQLGLAEATVKRWGDAATHLEEALATPTDPWIKRNRKALEDSLEDVRTHVGTLELRGEPSGAEVLIGGNLVARLPLDRPLRLSEGKTEIEVRSAGHKTWRKPLNVRAGSTEKLSVRLEVEPPSPPPEVARTEPQAPTSEPNIATAAGTDLPPTVADQNTTPPAPGRTLRYSGIAAGVVGLVGVGFGVKSSLRVQELNDKNPQKGTPDYKDGESAARNQYIGYGLGAAGLVSGAVLYYLGTRADREATSVAGMQFDVAASATGALWTITVRR
jgi:hypothetical protein